VSLVISAVDAQGLDVPLSPLLSDVGQTSGVSTGAVAMAPFAGMAVGVWEHSAGVSTDVEASEIFVVISGRGRVTCEQGGVIDLAPGVVGTLQAGARTRWEITEPLRKVWIAPLADTAQ
jgi:uncharacterized cupin superfamily protein